MASTTELGTASNGLMGSFKKFDDYIKTNSENIEFGTSSNSRCRNSEKKLEKSIITKYPYSQIHLKLTTL